MTDEELYVYDLMGYILIEDVLEPGDVAELNSLIDDYDLWENKGTGRFDQVWNYGEDFAIVGPLHRWDEPFRRLIDHPRILPYLVELVGAQVRYDIGHAIIMRKGGRSLPLHGGATPFRPDEYFLFRDGRMVNSHLTVSFALVDTGPGDGGFAAVPGSHKSNYRTPPQFVNFERSGPCLTQVPIRAGSVIVFSEGLTHGTWPWTADHERRHLLYKYSQGMLSWTREYPVPTDVPEAEWSEQARRLMEPPWVGHASEPMRRRPAVVESS
jgi:ectoine hydroxylase-related dioxygenase (phytanoyl-CoA dioxygenase family)